MDLLYRLGRATASEVLAELPDPPSYSAVRRTLSILEEKGHVRHESDGTRYLWEPTVGRQQARVSAMEHLLSTFFAGSPGAAVASLVGEHSAEMSDDELAELARLIERAREEGR